MSDCGDDGKGTKSPPPPPPSPPSTESCDPSCGCVDTDEFPFTAPFDARFPNQNQAKHCYVYFLDYQRCIKAKGECSTVCDYFKKVYTSMCPHEWVKKWNDQIENGIFAGKI